MMILLFLSFQLTMDIQLNRAAAVQFITSLSKSVQALCHGCMEFDTGIEIVGHININIDSYTKADYVLNEKVEKSTNNSVTFFSNSFLAKKDDPRQTSEKSCSPIPELRLDIDPMCEQEWFKNSNISDSNQMNSFPSQSNIFHNVNGSKRPFNWSDRGPARKRARGRARKSWPHLHSRQTSYDKPSSTDQSFNVVKSVESTAVSETTVKNEFLDSNAKEIGIKDADYECLDPSVDKSKADIKPEPVSSPPTAEEESGLATGLDLYNVPNDFVSEADQPSCSFNDQTVEPSTDTSVMANDDFYSHTSATEQSDQLENNLSNIIEIDDGDEDIQVNFGELESGKLFQYLLCE